MATVAHDLPATHLAVAYHRILVPVDGGSAAAAASTACTLAAEHGSTVSALAVIEVPAALPLDAHMLEEEASARTALAVAEAVGDERGVRVARLAVRARQAGEAIVEAAEESDAELVVLRRPLDKTARYVLKHARCRVLFWTSKP
jgi:nucleotide-binding universal stress UspA family protein